MAIILATCLHFKFEYDKNGVNQDTLSCVSGQESEKRHMAHKCGIYWYRKVAKFSLLYLQTTKLIFTKFIYVLLYIFVHHFAYQN